MGVKVSIIVPVYNVEKYIENCIQSLLNQTLKDIEIILVDGNSKDKSGYICDKYEKIDSRIKVIHTEDRGVSYSRNIGIKVAEGDFIGFVDSDDYVDKNMYKKLYDLCTENNCELSVCKLGREIDGKIINYEDNEFLKIMNNEEAMEELFKGVLYRFSLCNKLFKKDLFKDIAFPEGRIHEDLSTTYRLFANANKVTYINYIGYIYVKRSNSILTSKYNKKRLDAFIGWSEILDFINEKYPMLKDTVYACYTYACIDHMNYILNQVEHKDEKMQLLSVIRKNVNIYYKNILRNRILTKKYKILISILNYNSNLLVNLNSIRGR